MTLNEIQQKLKAPKGQTNSFGKYKYRSCEDILEAVKPLLGTATLTLSDEIVQVGDRYYVKATATLVDKDGAICTTAYAREPQDKKGNDEAQITGACSSYARKYALNGLFCIDDTKDADTDEHTQATKPEVKEISAYAKALTAISQITDPEGIEATEKRITNSTNLTDEEKTKLLESLDARAQLL
jgi:hypothetical protein